MSSIATAPPIASAAAVLFGRYGAVSHLAQYRGICRQAIYREAHHVVEAVAGTQTAHVQHRLEQRIAELQERLRAAQRQLQDAVIVDADRQAQFAATAQALGISLASAHALLRIVLQEQTPSRSTLGRRARAAARQAGATLAVLDAFSQPRARQVAADEIFAGRRPILMTVEQDSLCWLGARLADSRDGTEWAREFQQFPALEQLTRDGGQGLRKGLETINARRRRAGQAPVADQEDHFHLLQRARRALREVQHQAVRAYRQAEAAQRTFQRDAFRGLRRSPMRSRLAKRAWHKAEQAFERWTVQEHAFQRLRSALPLFTPEGELNTRARAEAGVQEALAVLTGPEWTRARRRLAAPETFTFLDRVHQRLATVPVAAEVRQQLVRAEGLRQRAEVLRGDQPQAAARRGVALLAGVVVALLGEAGPRAVQAVRSVLSQAWRASSLVEGVNSVLRMQQARQKRLTPELLALKRLHWNVQVFTAGRRKGQSPYARLGLILPGGSWWELLKIPPEQLRQQLSALNPAA
jgi:hypothetical protein